MQPPYFVLHQHEWHIAIKLDMQSYNIWMKKRGFGCSPLGGKLLWDKTIRQGTLATITGVELLSWYWVFNTLRPKQNGRHFPHDIFKWVFLNENVWFAINISLKFVPRGPINYIPTLVQVMAWRRQGNKPLSEPMKVRLPMHICITRPQWIKSRLCNLLESTGTQSSNEVQ